MLKHTLKNSKNYCKTVLLQNIFSNRRYRFSLLRRGVFQNHLRVILQVITQEPFLAMASPAFKSIMLVLPNKHIEVIFFFLCHSIFMLGSLRRWRILQSKEQHPIQQRTIGWRWEPLIGLLLGLHFNCEFLT
jgi:hypothetical protein